MNKNAFRFIDMLRIALAALLLAPAFAFAIPGDTDGDGIPDALEAADGRLPNVKDNEIFTNSILFVKQQYRDVLRREADAGGVAFWSQLIDAGSLQRQNFIISLMRSGEFVTAVAPIVRLYLAYFNRPGDYDGINYHIASRSLGVTLEQTADAFALSPEFVAMYGSKTNGEFVQLVYRNVLAREPDPSGYVYWVAELDSGRRSRGGVMLGFSESSEYGAKSYAKVVVNMVYIAMMQRTPDPAGFSFWVAQISTGMTDAQMIGTFYASVEYRDRFLNYYSMAATPAAIDAARFLTQASFGPSSLLEIANVQRYGYDQWLDNQFAQVPYENVGYVGGMIPIHNTGYSYQEDTFEAIWQNWLFSSDQLRARMAFALSEIMVISDVAPNLDPYAMASYMDTLGKNAFGNYRQLLEEVTLHPAMGFYLDMLKSQKEDTATGRHPNENYAREVLQLFSIGLVKLNIDGTPVLGTDGKAVPTYDEDTVRGFAKAFSGWSYGGADVTKSSQFFNAKATWTIPMRAWQSQHSQGDKTLLNGKVLPPFQTAEQDMEDALDNIFYHPNVGPFICLRLIHRFVTSNPSKPYIQRCASVFGNDGFGARGNLKAVLRQILMDPEARDPSVITSTTFGKQREPVIRFANYLKAFNARSTSGRNAIHWIDDPDDGVGQGPLLAPSVFNFFSPAYRPTGPIGAAGLVGPEFQITTETSVVGNVNFMWRLVDQGTYGNGDTMLKMDYSVLQAIALNPPMLADHINMLLMAGSMSAGLKDTIVRAVTAMPTSSTRNRVEAALTIAATAPEFVIQK